MHDKQKLFRQLVESFNLEELRTLCFHLSIEYDSLQGEGTTAKSRELVALFDRRHQLDRLAEAMKEGRQDIVLAPARPALPFTNTATVSVLYVCTAANQGSLHVLSQVPFVRDLLAGRQPRTLAQLCEIINREVLNRAVSTHAFLQQQRDNGVVLTVIDDLPAMLSLALDLAKPSRADGIPLLRMGLHSDRVDIGSDAGEQATVPADYINLAQRLAELGEGGHFLATQQAASLSTLDPRFAALFHHLSSYEIKYHKSLEIYNIYDSEQGIGNAARPTPKPPAPVVKGVSVPETLMPGRTKNIELTFYPGLSYIKVRFEVQNDDIQLTCKGQDGNDCTFEFRFSPGHDSYKRKVEIGVRRVELYLQEVIHIHFYDEADDPLSAPAIPRVSLLPPPTPPDRITDVVRLLRWLAYLIVNMKWYLKYPILVLLLITGLLYAALKADAVWVSQVKERILIGLRLWPSHFEGTWQEIFTPTSDNLPDPLNWSKDPLNKSKVEEWHLEDGISSNPDDKALLVEGEHPRFSQVSGGQSELYDFTVKFNITVLKDQHSAAWVLRAKDRDCYYLLKLNFPAGNSGATVAGYVVENGVQQPRPLASNSSGALPYYPFSENTRIYVTVEANGYEFKHIFKLDMDDPEDRNFYMPPYDIVFNDKAEQRYRYGALGFRVLKPNDRMKIEDVTVKDAH